LKKRLEGMEDRVATHEKTAKELEDQIFKINQPKPRKYSLKRKVTKPSAKTKGRAAAKPIRIQGVVTMGGKPLGNATISFVSNDESDKTVSDQEGRFQLSSKKLKAGEYSVTIKGKSVPKLYSAQEATPLRVELKNPGNQINFDLAF
jgi:hypothetical protein